MPASTEAPKKGLWTTTTRPCCPVQGAMPVPCSPSQRPCLPRQQPGKVLYSSVVLITIRLIHSLQQGYEYEYSPGSRVGVSVSVSGLAWFWACRPQTQRRKSLATPLSIRLGLGVRLAGVARFEMPFCVTGNYVSNYSYEVMSDGHVKCLHPSTLVYYVDQAVKHPLTACYACISDVLGMYE